MNKQYRVIFRADGGPGIGMGHYYRSLALAEMIKNDFYLLFATRVISENQKSEILKYCHEIIELPKDNKHYTVFLDKLKGNEIVVIDNYFFDSKYQKEILEKQTILVCIDDLVDKVFFTDILINPAPVSKAHYRSIASTQIFTGPDYALLREPFLTYAKNAVQGLIRNKFEKVFVTFGGDPDNVTVDCIKQLLRFKFIKEINVVTSSAFIYNAEIKALKGGTKQAVINQYDSLDSVQLVSLMTRCDFAILPCSSILYEALALHIPVMAGFYIDNQKSMYEGIIQKKINAIPIGDLRELRLKDYHFRLLKESGNFKTVDGKSKERFLEIFAQLRTQLEVNCRIASQKDFKILFDWANDDVVRKNAINSKPIDFQDHMHWFKMQMDSPDSYIYIFCLNGEDIGMVRFNISDNIAKITYSIDTKFRGKGLASIILRSSIKKLSLERTDISCFHAEVKDFNIPSIKAFLKIGFELTQEIKIGSTPYNIYRLKNKICHS